MDIKKAKIHFEAVYRTEADGIWRFCMWKISDRETALDLVSECFTRYWNELSRGAEILNDRAFLYTVARRLIIDHYRKNKPERFDEDKFDPPDEKAMDEIGAGAEARYAVSLIKSVSPANRQALYLRYVEGLEPQDIAKVLGISPNAASAKVHRGMGELRERLDPQKQ